MIKEMLKKIKRVVINMFVLFKFVIGFSVSVNDKKNSTDRESKKRKVNRDEQI